MKSKIKVKLLTALVLFGTVAAYAGTTGKIKGKVLDSRTGEGLPGANVIVVGTTKGAAADLDGIFIILGLPPGAYVLKASMIGYGAQTLENVGVSVDLTTKASFKLSETMLELGEEVVVTASREMITMDMTATQATISTDQIDALPVTEISDVIELQAGVVQGRDGNIHIRGGRSEEIVYMVDGMEMTDVYSGNVAVEVENSSVQELQVISGTFNAEYGRAMSGIINIVTKDGGDRISGSVTVYSADYVSGANDIFPHIDDFEPFNEKNLQFNLQGPVPFTGNKLKFFATGRYLDDNGFIFGTRIFNPADSSNTSFDDPNDWLIQATGDSEKVAMRFNNKKTFHGKLSYQIMQTMKLSTNLLVTDADSRNWGDEGDDFTPENEFHDFYRFLLNPDGASKQFQNSYTLLVTLDHLLNSRTFYNLNFSMLENKVRSFVFEDPFDPRYVDPDRFIAPLSAGNTFYIGGTDMWQSRRKTRTMVGKFDLTSQVTNTHQLKGGIELRKHRLEFQEFKIVPENENAAFVPSIPGPESPFNNSYTHEPTEFAAYFQDKMEFDYMIVNLGVRFDYFDPNAPVPTDLTDPTNPAKRKAASAKTNISPRLGVAYPITDRGVLHFSIGQFFQMPIFQFLYADSEFEVQIGRLQTLMGNADLEPQKTTQYEVGLQQQLSEDLAFDFTVFYKDIRNLLGTEINQTIEADQYARYINRDFGNSRGFVFALTQRHSNWLAANIDYTFQIAEGNASEPNSAFEDARANREPEKKLVPLDWDQRHTLNASMTISPGREFSVTLLGRYGSGLPYTPTFLNIRRAFENTARSQSTVNIDLKADYKFSFAGLRNTLFLKVFNVLDARNEVIVYSSTGRAGFNLEWPLTTIPRGVNTRQDFFFDPPHHYSEPRKVLLGLTVGF